MPKQKFLLSDRPIMATAGPIVSGVIHLNRGLKKPKQKLDY
jgi:hypothetical protein